MHISRCDLANPIVCERVHALQRAAYRVEAELINCWLMPGLIETIDELQRSQESFLAASFEPDPSRSSSAMARGLIAGIIATEFESDPSAPHATRLRISRLAVDPAFHLRGVGSALVRAVLARERGIIVVSTGAANIPARRVYERAGFFKSRDFSTPDGRSPLVEYRIDIDPESSRAP